MNNHDSAATNILIATDNTADANLIRKQLKTEFENIIMSTDPDKAVEDFESHRPDVLILAFDSLNKSELYYLEIYRRSHKTHSQPHRTVLLCNKGEVKIAYRLCKKGLFDDYIMFWPMTHDAMRLPMSVHHALRELAAARTSVPSAAQFAAQAHRIAELEALLDQQMAQGGDNIEQECAPQLESVRTLDAMIERIQPVVLMVDDDEFQHKIAGKILKNQNYQLIFSTGGIDALKILRKIRPDLILIDVMMPDMNGLELVRELKSAPQLADIPVIMITGQSDENVVIESLKAGATDFVVKPFDHNTLISKVTQALS